MLGEGENGSSETQEALIELALRPHLTPQERKGAFKLLTTLFPEDTLGPREMADHYIGQFRKRMGTERHDPARGGYLDVLSRCSSADLQEFFWHELTDGYRYGHRRYTHAVRWWTGSAPYESLQWFGEQTLREDGENVVGWLRRLRRSDNERFRNDPKLRRNLLGPLIRHDDHEVRKLAAELIEVGPRQYTY